MLSKSRKFIIIILFFLASYAFSFQIERKGNSIIGVDLSLTIPLFLQDLNGYYKTNLLVGGLGALNYQYFLTNNIGFGAEVRYYFNFDKNFSLDFLNPDNSVGNTFYSVPITFLVTYILNINEIIQIPFVGNLGVSINSYGTQAEISNARTIDGTPVLALGSGINININYKWSMAILSNWWMFFETGSKESGNKIGNFLLTSVGVRVNLSR